MRHLIQISLALCLLVACGQSSEDSSRTAGEAAPDAAPALATPVRLTTDESSERDADFSPDGQWVSFGSTRSGNEDIWKMPAGGGEAVQLTRHLADDLYASWSPDGTRLCFTSERDGQHANVWTVSADGAEERQITADADSVVRGGGSICSWSPDGTHIAYSAVHSGIAAIWVTPEAGGAARQITEGPVDWLPDWSPDGRSIAFASNRTGNGDLWVQPLDGGPARQVTTHPSSDWAGAWSPDGRWLAFSSNRTGNIDLWVVPAEGGPARQVTDTPGKMEFVPRWSVDGTHLAYNAGALAALVVWDMDTDAETVLVDAARCGAWSPSGDEVAYLAPVRGGVRALYRLPAAGGDARLVSDAIEEDTDFAFIFSHIAWTPDGKQIAYAATHGGESELWSIPVDGGEPGQLTVTPGAVGHPAWAPDGKRLVFVHTVDGQRDLWLLDVSGWTARPLVSTPADEVWPSWSPDGRRIVFHREAMGASDADRIGVVAVDGGPVTWLAEGIWPQWMPDGERILFTRRDGSLRPVPYTIAVAGGEPVRVRDLPMWVPQISPDGTRILYLRYSNNDIWLADMTTILGAG